METATINGKSYEIIRREAAGLRTAEDMRARGWDGFWYVLRGARGATYLAYRTMAGGFSVACKGGR